MNWTLTLGFLWFSLAMGTRIYHSNEKPMGILSLALSGLISAYLTVLIFKWAFNHGLAVVFGFPHLHFQEALFLDIFLTGFIPISFKRVIVDD